MAGIGPLHRIIISAESGLNAPGGRLAYQDFLADGIPWECWSSFIVECPSCFCQSLSDLPLMLPLHVEQIMAISFINSQRHLTEKLALEAFLFPVIITSSSPLCCIIIIIVIIICHDNCHHHRLAFHLSVKVAALTFEPFSIVVKIVFVSVTQSFTFFIHLD